MEINGEINDVDHINPRDLLTIGASSKDSRGGNALESHRNKKAVNH